MDDAAARPFSDEVALKVEGVEKTFVMHLRGGARIPVLANSSFAVRPGECVALVGPSGAGKSTLLRMIYGNYRCDQGRIVVRTTTGWMDIVKADARSVVAARRDAIGYVSQFLRAIPRVSTLSIVAGAGRDFGMSLDESELKAKALLARLNIREQLWNLPPVTFSGGEQQRVNIARGVIGRHRVLLLDEPTASLDSANREVVVDLILERKASGTAIVGIFHDTDARRRVADREIDLAGFQPLAQSEVAA